MAAVHSGLSLWLGSSASLANTSRLKTALHGAIAGQKGANIASVRAGLDKETGSDIAKGGVQIQNHKSFADSISTFGLAAFANGGIAVGARSEVAAEEFIEDTHTSIANSVLDISEPVIETATAPAAEPLSPSIFDAVTELPRTDEGLRQPSEDIFADFKAAIKDSFSDSSDLIEGGVDIDTTDAAEAVTSAVDAVSPATPDVVTDIPDSVTSLDQPSEGVFSDIKAAIQDSLQDYELKGEAISKENPLDIGDTVSPSIVDGANAVPEITKPTFALPENLRSPDFDLPKYSIPKADSITPPADKPQFNLPNFSEFQAPDFKLPEFEAPQFKLPEFKLPDFQKPEFTLPDSSELTLPKPDIKLPEFSFPEFQLPIPKLPALKQFSLPEISLPPQVTEPVNSALESAKASIAAQADSAFFVISGKVGETYALVKSSLPPESLYLVDMAEKNVTDLSKVLSEVSEGVFAKVVVASTALIRTAFAAAGYEPDDESIKTILILSGATILIIASWRAVYGGYSGNLSAEDALKLLQEKKAVLVDIRPEEIRDADGIPDLRRGARTKAAAVEFEKLPGSDRRQLKSADKVELQLMAAKIRATRAFSSGNAVVVLDQEGSGRAKAIARGLSTFGFQRAYLLDGGFSAWVENGLRVKPNEEETAVDVIKKETEAFVEEVKPTPVKVASAFAVLGLSVYTLLEWQKSLQLFGIIAATTVIYSRFQSYETEEDLQKDIRILLAPFVFVGNLIVGIAGASQGSSAQLVSSPQVAETSGDDDSEENEGVGETAGANDTSAVISQVPVEESSSSVNAPVVASIPSEPVAESSKDV